MAIYERGNGGITLSQSQISQLRQIYDNQLIQYNSDPDQVGLGAPIYELLLDCLTDTSGNKLGNVDQAVFDWLQGAVRINESEGFASAYIREYTLYQFEARGGQSTPSAA